MQRIHNLGTIGDAGRDLSKSLSISFFDHQLNHQGDWMGFDLYLVICVFLYDWLCETAKARGKTWKTTWLFNQMTMNVLNEAFGNWNYFVNHFFVALAS